MDMEKAWEEYQLTALVTRPAKALSKREFEAGFAAAQALADHLARKLEAISKLVAEPKYKLSGDRDSYSQYWEGYEYCQDLVQQIIESPEEEA